MGLLFSSPPVHQLLDTWGVWALAPFSSDENMKIVFVVTIWPPITGVVEFWIQDSFLKSSRRKHSDKHSNKDEDDHHRSDKDVQQELLMIDQDFMADFEDHGKLPRQFSTSRSLSMTSREDIYN
jgi:hypothetical protein